MYTILFKGTSAPLEQVLRPSFRQAMAAFLKKNSKFIGIPPLFVIYSLLAAFDRS
jgi:hypothetical protein